MCTGVWERRERCMFVKKRMEVKYRKRRRDGGKEGRRDGGGMKGGREREEGEGGGRKREGGGRKREGGGRKGEEEEREGEGGWREGGRRCIGRENEGAREVKTAGFRHTHTRSPSMDVKSLYDISVGIGQVQGVCVQVNGQGVNILEVGSDQVNPSRPIQG